MLLRKFKYEANYQYIISKLEEKEFNFYCDNDELSIFCNNEYYLVISKYIESLKIDENDIDTEYFSYDEYINWHFHKYKLSEKTGRFPFFLFSKAYIRFFYFYLFIILLSLIFVYFYS